MPGPDTRAGGDAPAPGGGLRHRGIFLIRVAMEAVPKMAERSDSLGNTYKIGVLGVGQSRAQGDVRTIRYGPAAAFRMALVER